MKPSDLQQVLAATISNRQPVLIKGAPGIGKSDIVAQAAEAAGAALILSHPVVSDPTDYKGLPGIVNDKAEFLPFGELRQAVEATEPTVFFLDDLGQAPPSVQAACMQLLLARRVNGHKVSDLVTFIAATNRREDRAGVQGMLEPVKSRFATILHLEPDLDDWVKWALSAQMPIELISFIRYRPNLLHDFKASSDLVNTPSPRTVSNVGRLMGTIPTHLEYEVFTGAAGEGFAAEFMGFLKIFRNLPNPDSILLNPGTAAVPTDPATLYALAGALSRKVGETNMDAFCTYINRMPAEFNVLSMKQADEFSNHAVTRTRAFVQWSSDHKELLI
jgi:hypothetical protein